MASGAFAIASRAVRFGRYPVDQVSRFFIDRIDPTGFTMPDDYDCPSQLSQRCLSRKLHPAVNYLQEELTISTRDRSAGESENGLFMAKLEFSVRTPGHASRCDCIRKFLLLLGTAFEPWMKKALELVDGYLGYLFAKLSALPLVTSPYYSKHVARKLGAGHSPLGPLCNITLQRSCKRGLFSHGHSPHGALSNVTQNPL